LREMLQKLIKNLEQMI
jgi:intraflagellar transport protein 172